MVPPVIRNGVFGGVATGHDDTGGRFVTSWTMLTDLPAGSIDQSTPAGLARPRQAHVIDLRHLASSHDPFGERTQRLYELDCPGTEGGHQGCGQSISGGFNGIASLGAYRSGTIVVVNPFPLSKMHDRRSPLLFGPPSVDTKALPFRAPSHCLHDK